MYVSLFIETYHKFIKYTKNVITYFYINIYKVFQCLDLYYFLMRLLIHAHIIR